MSYGHALKTAGRQEESIDAYRKQHRAGAGPRRGLLEPREPEDLPLLRRTTSRRCARSSSAADLSAEDRLHFHFALGKALEDARDYARVVRALRGGQSAAPRRSCRYDADDDRPSTCADRKRCSRREFFAARRGCGLRRRRTRSSSSACRGPARRWSSRSCRATPRSKARWNCRTSSASSRNWAAASGAGEASQLPGDPRDAGRRRAARTRRALPASRRASSARPTRRYFIDKMPNNWAHVGPDPADAAEREDHRRAPASAELLLLRVQAALRARPELHATGSTTSAATTATTSTLMAHFDAVLPGRVHRVIYERMVDDTETEVRRLLDYCGLPFEEACLRFYENDRAVRTASSEQVRRPILPRRGRAVAPLRTVAGPAAGRARARCSTPTRGAAACNHECMYTHHAGGCITEGVRCKMTRSRKRKLQRHAWSAHD